MDQSPSTASSPENLSDGRRRFILKSVSAILLPIVFAAGIGVGYLIWGFGTPDSTFASNNPTGTQPSPTTPSDIETADEEMEQPSSELTQAPPRLSVRTDDAPVLGSNQAPVTIIEFGDFSCGFCRRWHQEIFPQLIQAYPEQVRFVYRDYPIISDEAFIAAQAAECAREQGAYWEYFNLLWSDRGLGLAAYQEYALELGLDTDQHSECLQSNKYAAEVEAEAQYAASLGIRGTPTFFINGIPLVGAQPLEAFIQVIESELGS